MSGAGLPSWARVGAKVVCGDADPRGGSWFGVAPVVGRTYVLVEHRGTPKVEPCAAFTTIDGRLVHGGGAVWICRFRPLVATKSEAEDLALFRHHLDQNVPERERA